MASSPSFVAPQRWAITPGLTDAPELWRRCIWAYAPPMNNTPIIGSSLTNPQPRQFGTRGIYEHFVQTYRYSTTSMPQTSEWSIFLLVNLYTGNHGGSALISNSSGTSQWETGSLQLGFNSYKYRFNLNGSSGGYIDTNFTASYGTHGLLAVFDHGAMYFWVDGNLIGSANTSFTTYPVSYPIVLGSYYDQSAGRSPVFNLYNSFVTAEAFGQREADLLQRDPFAMFRPRVRRVVVVSGNTGSIKQGAGSSYSFAPIIIAPAAFQATAKANDTQIGVAQIAAGITESVQSGDSDLGPANVPVNLSAKASGNDTVDQIANAASAIAEGVRSGETWTATAQAYAATLSGAASGDTEQATAQAMASLQSGASSSDTEKTTASGVYTGAITEGTKASSRFVAAVAAIAGISDQTGAGDRSATQHTVSTTESASISDAVTTVISALVAIGEGSAASDKWSLNLAGTLAHLTEAVNASAVTTARSSVLATISETAKAGAIFSIKAGGYLVAGAITLVSALQADINLDTALDSDKYTYPALNADIH